VGGRGREAYLLPWARGKGKTAGPVAKKGKNGSCTQSSEKGKNMGGLAARGALSHILPRGGLKETGMRNGRRQWGGMPAEQ